MDTFKIGDILLVKFPFSDLSGYKLRPSIVLISEKQNDYILCQITSKSYSDNNSIVLNPSDCINGSLDRISYIRPLKIFTCNDTIIYKKICTAKTNILNSLIEKIISALKNKS